MRRTEHMSEILELDGVPTAADAWTEGPKIAGEREQADGGSRQPIAGGA
jgi:hypothetical protein